MLTYIRSSPSNRFHVIKKYFTKINVNRYEDIISGMQVNLLSRCARPRLLHVRTYAQKRNRGRRDASRLHVDFKLLEGLYSYMKYTIHINEIHSKKQPNCSLYYNLHASFRLIHQSK